MDTVNDALLDSGITADLDDFFGYGAVCQDLLLWVRWSNSDRLYNVKTLSAPIMTKPSPATTAPTSPTAMAGKTPCPAAMAMTALPEQMTTTA